MPRRLQKRPWLMCRTWGNRRGPLRCRHAQPAGLPASTSSRFASTAAAHATRGLLFYRLIEGALAADPHPYTALLTPRSAPDAICLQTALIGGTKWIAHMRNVGLRPMGGALDDGSWTAPASIAAAVLVVPMLLQSHYRRGLIRAPRRPDRTPARRPRAHPSRPMSDSPKLTMLQTSGG